MQANVDIIQTLLEMRNGKVASDINRKFAELLNAIYEHRKKGSITLKIDIAPAKFDDSMMVTEVSIDPEVKLNKPDRPLDSAMFFVTSEGKLSRLDPAQHQMFDETEINRHVPVG